MPETRPRRFWLFALCSSAIAVIVAACKNAPAPTAAEVPAPAAPPQPTVTGPVAGPDGSARISAATTPRAYRQDGASHLYGLNADRIYKGRMPPLLYAVGVLNVDIDRRGRVTHLDWMRAPRHAPEVMREIEKMIQAASPFPVPARLGKVTYTDTWLWHKTGKFQLDTLTEGQD